MSDLLPKTNLGMVDINKWIYNTTKNYVPLLQAGITKVVMLQTESAMKVQKPFIAIDYLTGSTNSAGIRKTIFTFNIFAENIEKAQEIKEIVVDLYNRSNLEGVRSKIDRDYGIWANHKEPYIRMLIDFEFVYKDQNY